MSLNYIKLIKPSITNSPAFADSIALPSILPALASLSAFALPSTSELTYKSPLFTGPLTLTGTLPANAIAG